MQYRRRLAVVLLRRAVVPSSQALQGQAQFSASVQHKRLAWSSSAQSGMASNILPTPSKCVGTIGYNQMRCVLPVHLGTVFVVMPTLRKSFHRDQIVAVTSTMFRPTGIRLLVKRAEHESSRDRCRASQAAVYDSGVLRRSTMAMCSCCPMTMAKDVLDKTPSFIAPIGMLR
jgi:hypothetical protein